MESILNLHVVNLLKILEGSHLLWHKHIQEGVVKVIVVSWEAPWVSR